MTNDPFGLDNEWLTKEEIVEKRDVNSQKQGSLTSHLPSVASDQRDDNNIQSQNRQDKEHKNRDQSQPQSHSQTPASNQQKKGETSVEYAATAASTR